MDLHDASMFPPLADAPPSTDPSPADPASARRLDRLWSNIIASPAPSAPHIPVSLIETPKEIIPFESDFTCPAAAEWNLCLVGYSIGKRPYYEALNETAKRIWKLKGIYLVMGWRCLHANC
ncbi:uncharacterized protein LOC114579300 [Dendrobium catenatum]|uniref:uncharacterized protein LOC114579300 n=1 Tax=Dendrobium catenatum TaxID=906689 RepID=UPI0010A0C1A0|nr:uncharacterized protein LOC114579300 [Dendrobium catenatum]